MRIAIIGSGIAGLVCAWKLGQAHDVTLYEANDYLGGHTHTHDVEQDGRRYAVDSGFIVHNPSTIRTSRRCWRSWACARSPPP